MLRQFLILALTLVGAVSSQGTAICWEQDGSVHVEAGFDGRCFDVATSSLSNGHWLDSPAGNRCSSEPDSCIDAATYVGRVDTAVRSELTADPALAYLPSGFLVPATPELIPERKSRLPVPVSSFASSHLSSVILRT